MGKAKKVLIIGAGLSGLACARVLAEKKVPFQILEATESLGGRVKTEVSREGFRFDLGFQVLLDSYPELKKCVDIPALQLQKFKSGALIYSDTELKTLANPLLHPSKMIETLFNSEVNLSDKYSLIQLIIKSLNTRGYSISSGITTMDFLRQLGFRDSFIDFFWRPFLGGVYLDSALSLDANYFLFLIRCFGLGHATVPRLGMEELPKNVAAPISKEHFLFARRAVNLQSNNQGASVQLENGDTLEADVVVQSYQPSSEALWRSVTTYYLTTLKKPSWGPWLVLVPPSAKMTVNHIAVMSDVSSNYAPPGHTLIAANVLGNVTSETAKHVIGDLEKIAKRPLHLELLRTKTISKALPVVPLHPRGTQETYFTKNERIYQCGDFLSNPSIQFALKSGRLTGMQIYQDHFES